MRLRRTDSRAPQRAALVFLAAALLPLGAIAQESPDGDGDGFSDSLESTGLTLAQGLTLTTVDGAVVTTIQSCVESELPRSDCLDPSTQDLFAILVPAAESALPADPFRSTSAPVAEGGLGLGVHVLNESADATRDRVVSASGAAQKAVRITESLSAPGDALGFANYGTPNSLDGSTIYTTRVLEFVTAACKSDALCATSTGETGIADVADALTRYVINHELGHLFSLTASYDKRFGGFHVKAGEDEVLSQFADYDTSKRSGMTTFYIPETFSDQSRADKRLQ